MQRQFRLSAAIFLLLVAGSACATDSLPLPAPDSGRDADSTSDSGAAADTSAPTDPPDSAAPRDTTGELDITDTGAEPDAHITPDTSSEPDIHTAPDTSSEPDTHTEPDTYTEPDTSSEPDSGAEPDPDPPGWNCSEVSCAEVDRSVALGEMVGLDGCAWELSFEEPISEGKALADRLIDRVVSDAGGARRTIEQVLNNLNREGRSGLNAQTTARLSGLNPEGFRWNTGDDNVTYWSPQGMSGSSDARASGEVDGKKLILTAWYHDTDERPTRGARLALADITDLNSVDYRLLLLVDPIEKNGKPDYKESAYDAGGALHSGGIVWYGDYLFVADTHQGFRVYDMSRIFRVGDWDEAEKIGIHGSLSHAHGYAYVVPRIARYKWTSDSCKARFSFIGLDRGADPPALVSGEYLVDDHNGKVLTWPLDPSTHLLEEREGTTRASAGAVMGQTRAQGSVRVGNYFYISSSSQDGSDGRLYKGRPGSTNSSVNWVYGAEDLYYQRDAGRIWTHTLYPGHREIVGIPLP